MLPSVLEAMTPGKQREHSKEARMLILEILLLLYVSDPLECPIAWFMLFEFQGSK